MVADNNDPKPTSQDTSPKPKIEKPVIPSAERIVENQLKPDAISKPSRPDSKECDGK